MAAWQPSGPRPPTTTPTAADRSRPLLFTAAAVVPFLLTLIASDHPTGLATGEILYLVLGLLQLLAAAAAALLGLGRITFTAHPEPAPPPKTDGDADADDRTP
ncbi:hypothetical protein ACFC6L_09195 [Kitasatospora phosalacinea]|uniref:hypothetical protein n=1 Tax=Kitasatospora phosalacinea TaxID=2065 RepID=UPI0035E05CFA